MRNVCLLSVRVDSCGGHICVGVVPVLTACQLPETANWLVTDQKEGLQTRPGGRHLPQQVAMERKA